jgi:hypothetical protein
MDIDNLQLGKTSFTIRAACRDYLPALPTAGLPGPCPIVLIAFPPAIRPLAALIVPVLVAVGHGELRSVPSSLKKSDLLNSPVSSSKSASLSVMGIFFCQMLSVWRMERIVFSFVS